LQVDVSSALQRGRDPLESKREQRRAAEVDARTLELDARTLEVAVREYTLTKTRTKDGKTLKPRTRGDYLSMVAPARTEPRARAAGGLHSLASKPLHKISADEIRKLYAALEPRGERRRAYAMQVLRAVLRYEGVSISGDPFAPSTAGAQRVRLPATKGDPRPIPPERLGAWWRAAGGMASTGADQLKFSLLTGCRPGEAAGIRVGDFDIPGRRVTLRDTKNRSDHTLVLATQAAAIACWHTERKQPTDLLFGIKDAGKSLDVINAEAGVVGITAHKLRHTFASIAAELVPHFVLRRMLNHTSGSDTAAQHYVHVSEAQLRAGWQSVADFIESAA
jgi:integrase